MLACLIAGVPIWDINSGAATVMAYDADAIRVDELGTHDNRHAQVTNITNSLSLNE